MCSPPKRESESQWRWYNNKNTKKYIRNEKEETTQGGGLPIMGEHPHIQVKTADLRGKEQVPIQKLAPSK